MLFWGWLWGIAGALLMHYQSGRLERDRAHAGALVLGLAVIVVLGVLSGVLH